jgi:spore germination cell wall hydrolase CwlJ-like protein
MTIFGKAAKAAAGLIVLAVTLNGSAVASAFEAMAAQNNAVSSYAVQMADVADSQAESQDSDVPKTDDVAKQPTPMRDLASLVSAHAADDTADSDEKCLAGAIYFEAKGESFEGQLAVAQVVLNRMNSGRFARSICGVVFQSGQFSFVRGGTIPAVRTNNKGWRDAVAISRIARAKLHPSNADDALFFHAKRVSPRWKLTRVAAIGNHVFYR